MSATSLQLIKDGNAYTERNAAIANETEVRFVATLTDYPTHRISNEIENRDLYVAEDGRCFYVYEKGRAQAIRRDAIVETLCRMQERGDNISFVFLGEQIADLNRKIEQAWAHKEKP